MIYFVPPDAETLMKLVRIGAVCLAVLGGGYLTFALIDCIKIPPARGAR